MSDLEQELAGVLAGVAEQAPGAVGLADAARRRHRGRRQRRLAVGGAAVALVIGVGAAVVGGLGGDQRATDPTDDPAPEGWQTIGQGDATAMVPSNWTKSNCAPRGSGSRVMFSPPEADPCQDGAGAFWVTESDFDLEIATGYVLDDREDPSDPASAWWRGNVSAGDVHLVVATRSEALTRQILGSARSVGTPEVDVAAWLDFEKDGVSFAVPARWGLGATADLSDYAVCVDPERTRGSSSAGHLDNSHYEVREVRDFEGTITVTAPTQAIAELTTASVLVDVGGATGTSCGPDDFSTGLLPGESTPGAEAPEASGVPALAEVENDGVSFSILDGWREKSCGGLVQYTPGPACRSIQQSEGIQFLDASSFEPAMDEGVLRPGGSSAKRLWAGYVLRGRWAVLVVHPDKETAQTLLGLVR